MTHISVNRLQLDARQIKSVKMYVSITQNHSYRSVNHRHTAQKLVNFMKRVYIMDHPFDELNMCENVFTDAVDVANLLTVAEPQKLSDILEVCIDFDNMVSLSAEHWQNINSLFQSLSAEQSRLIEWKTTQVTKRHTMQLQLQPSKTVAKLISPYFEKEKPRPESVDLSTVDKSLIISEKAKGSRSKTHKKICQ